MDLKTLTSAVIQIAEERGIPEEKVIETVEAALAAAYKKNYGEKGQIIKAKLDIKTGRVKFWRIRMVVDKDMIYTEKELESLKGRKEKDVSKIRFNSEKHIMLSEAKKIDPKIKAGEDLKIPLKTQKTFGRIAAQTAKQVIFQKIEEAERETIYEEYKHKEGEIISGIVQRIEGKNVIIDIGRTLGILPPDQQVPGEFYKPKQRLKFYITKIEKTPKGPVIILSRSYPKLVSKLFELEVPEISEGLVEIKSIAREAGSRTKIAVASEEENIDPIGSTVGQRGTRVSAVITELGGEKIDIIEWSSDPKKYIANALAPAKILEVKIKPKNEALVIVSEDQLSLAIGRDGQNVRLAAQLTGWKIDVKAQSDEEEEGGREEENDDVKQKESKKEEKESEAKQKE